MTAHTGCPKATVETGDAPVPGRPLAEAKLGVGLPRGGGPL
jgi:hypothetical protein